MRLILILTLISICFADFNITNSSTTTICEKCSPCWNLFNKNYKPCTKMDYTINPFQIPQPMCIDTLILFVILLLGIISLIPTILWLLYLWLKHKQDNDDDIRYIIDDSANY